MHIRFIEHLRYNWECPSCKYANSTEGEYSPEGDGEACCESCGAFFELDEEGNWKEPLE